jgi:hypothetical protein
LLFEFGPCAFSSLRANEVSEGETEIAIEIATEIATLGAFFLADDFSVGPRGKS